MPDDTMQPGQRDRSEQEMPTRSGDDAPQPLAGVPDSLAQRTQPSAPGRRPLFRS